MWKIFLVACYATLHPALSVRLSVGPSHFTFFGFLQSMASLLLPKWSSDRKYSPCPPARDWGSRVSGLVISWHTRLGWDWAQMKDFLKLFPDLTNSSYLSLTKEGYGWTKTYTLGSRIRWLRSCMWGQLIAGLWVRSTGPEGQIIGFRSQVSSLRNKGGHNYIN